MGFFFGWLIFSGVVAYIASSRGRLAFDYFLISVLLSPLIGLVILLTKPNLTEEAKKTRLRREDQDWQIDAMKSTQGSAGHDEVSKLAPSAAGMLVADEIEKLASLLNKGALTDEEFQARKSLLLKQSPWVQGRPFMNANIFDQQFDEDANITPDLNLPNAKHVLHVQK